ncbi:sensor histidine kinase [Wielerella bovis]|uniref:sensor histidine kinase n=1 Tax=Wielerella bovis TaxID=2917790 RepID=UPI002019339B|nr:HAMP domain-containing sensor histidine kinase [Wielerella bovis]ULJ61571.1 HAMP domain-containing histidine kinase [Wielerella bovis]ULJ66136.1 HAMP domain-containing histidine kinase [Wielerella bovis]
MSFEPIHNNNHQDWEEQSLRMMNLLNIARISIWFSLLIFLAVIHNMKDAAATITTTYSPLVQNEGLLQIWCGVYGFIIMLSIARPTWQRQPDNSIPNGSALVDITMMAVLTGLAGGVSSGFGILVLPFLAAACVLSYGRFALVYASYSALLILIEVFWRFFPFSSENLSTHLSLLTGQLLLIAACYIVPALTSFSASYLLRADDSLKQHRTAYERVSAINKIVLNRVQETVVVLDKESRVWMHNRQAKQHFSQLQAGEIAQFLQPLVTRWLRKPKQAFETTFEINNALMHIRAMPLIQGESELLTLLIRSDKERQIEAQTVKLTSLGLLTANLAHEIRNPLSAMRQSNGLLLEMAQENDDLMIERLSGIIEKNIARVDKMIEDVSALNKSDRRHPEVIHLMKFWMGFVQEFQMTRPDAKGCLKLDMSKQRFEVIFDPMHLQQIIWNLCNNAWRHSEKKKESVIVRVRPLGAHHISLRVWDDGPGVAENMQAHLFEPFNTNQSEGTGLGLYVARELAHANKGDLRYIPEAKSFELILPRHDNEQK